ncbi:MAG: MalY/PatB family protein [Pseudomonadota bacterium]
MNFDDMIERRGTSCLKWDRVEDRYDVPPDALPMWVADMDFRAPEFVLDAARTRLDHGVFGYGHDMDGYLGAIAWWMKTRHGWEVDPASVFTTTGLCNAIALLLEAYTAPGDGIVTFTPVYHAFDRTIRGTGRRTVEIPLERDGDRYVMNLDASALTGDEKVLLFCSPHNPVGRVWSRDELQAVATFADTHDLLLISDEIHHDLVFPGHTHVPMTAIDGIAERLIMLTAPSKTFNLAGMSTGNVVIADPKLRAPFANLMRALHIESTELGITMASAAYSPEGAAWVDALVAYLDTNRRAFDAGVNALPGLSSIPLEATYLSWVDFSGTGMTQDEIVHRVEREAGIAANHGTTFGRGGEGFMRFNLGTQRAHVDDALRRLTSAFGDLQ